MGLDFSKHHPGMPASPESPAAPTYEVASFQGSSILDMATSAVKEVTAATDMLRMGGKEARPLKWAIFTPPKPFAKAPHQMVALRSWLNLRVPPQVFFIEADDLDPVELAAIREEYGVHSLPCATNAEGFLLQNAIFERASMEQDFDAVVVVNADIILGDDFLEALEHAEATFDRFLLVGARYDNLTPQTIPADADAAWIQAFRDRTWEEGALHTYGGSDYFAWRPVGDPALAAIGGRIPPFTYGRGKADNWIIDMAVKNGVVEVVDATTAVFAVHPAHGYENVNVNQEVAGVAAAQEMGAAAQHEAETQRDRDRERGRKLKKQQEEEEEEKEPAPVTKVAAAVAAVSHRRLVDTTTGKPPPPKYVNYWSAKAAGDPQADMNKYLAYKFGSFQNGEGTPLHAPWQLMRCVEAETQRGGRGGYVEKPCLRYRTRPGACPCENSPMVPRTLTDVEMEGKQRLCGRAPTTLTEEFEGEFAFKSLLGQQAQNETVVLIGFNYGYQDMLLNMVCRLQQLEVPNYVIAAFDAESMAFCRREVLPCFPVNDEIAAKADSIIAAEDAGMDSALALGRTQAPTKPPVVDLQSAAHAFGTKGFRALTKLKSQQVLRILELGYNVMWSDVDIFWKVNPMPALFAEMGERVDIAIQSNAPPEEAAENGKRRINSGFYLAKSNPSVVEAFRQIVDHARQSTLSEQPSFYTVLCGDELEYVAGKAGCMNPVIPVTTHFLSRQVYPNGAMVDVVRGVTPVTEDDVAIVHFNWLEGHDAKVQSFVNASMWMLQADETNEHTCMYSSRMGSRAWAGRNTDEAGKTVLSPPDAQQQPPRALRRHL